MRYVTLIFAALLTVGCAATEDARTHYDEKMIVRGFDFTGYGDFLITPEGYNGEYQSVGQLQVTIYPAMNRTLDGGGKTPRGLPWRARKIDPKRAVDSLYAQAKRLGADAIIRFTSTTVTESIQDGTRTGVQARGFAIDRAEN